MSLAGQKAAAKPAPPPALAAGGGIGRRGDDSFTRFSDLVRDRIGVKLPDTKRLMVEGRLRRRMSSLGFRTTDEYFRHLFADGNLETEFQVIVNAVTTNKTDFFREPPHFDTLTQHILPQRLARRPARGRNDMLKIWSAAASTGAEAYTIAMVLAEYARQNAPFEWGIFGSDINSEVLREARRAVYSHAMIEPVAPAIRERYLLRGHGRLSGYWRISPQLRKRVMFDSINLMDKAYPVDTGLDVIFLRNVLIYFENDDQIGIITRLTRHLATGGHLIVGHSESMIVRLPGLTPIAPSVYRKE